MAHIGKVMGCWRVAQAVGVSAGLNDGVSYS